MYQVNWLQDYLAYLKDERVNRVDENVDGEYLKYQSNHKVLGTLYTSQLLG